MLNTFGNISLIDLVNLIARFREFGDIKLDSRLFVSLERLVYNMALGELF